MARKAKPEAVAVGPDEGVEQDEGKGEDAYAYEQEEGFEEDADQEGSPRPEEQEEPLPEPSHPLPDSNHAEHLELVDGRRLHPTPRLWLLFGIGALLALAAVLLFFGARQTVWAGICGGVASVILLVAFFTSLSVRGGCKRAYVDVSRTVEAPERPTVGDMFTATLDASRCSFPGATRVRMRETPGAGLTPVEATRLYDPGVVTYKVRCNQRGKQKLRGVDILLTDPLGLWIQERRYKLETELEVFPGVEALGLRAQIGGQMAFLDGTPKAMIHIFRDVESEHQHEYGPGDRLKEVDWKVYGKTGQMLVRQRILEASTHALILFDVGTSMMMPRKGRRSIDIALEYAHEIIASATNRTVAVGYLAFNDTENIDFMRPSKKRALKYQLPDKFRYFTDPLRTPERKEPARKLLQEQPIEQGLNRVFKSGLGPKTSILLFTDLDTINNKIVNIVAKVAQGGVKTAVILLPHPTFEMKKRFREAGGKAPNGFRGKKVRKELREVLMAQDVEFLDLRAAFGDVEQ